MQYQDDNQPTASPEMPVADMGCQSGEGEARFIPNGRSVPVGNFTERAIDRWKASSPFEQERLEFLKQVIAEGNEQELYDQGEQKKFGLEKDEFLVCAQGCSDRFTKFSVLLNRILLVLAVLIPLVAIIEYFPIESLKNSMPTDLIIFVPYMIFAYICIRSSFDATTVTILITNKNAYHFEENYYTNDPLNNESKKTLKKISLCNMSIKHSIKSTDFTDDCLKKYGNSIRIIFNKK